MTIHRNLQLRAITRDRPKDLARSLDTAAADGFADAPNYVFGCGGRNLQDSVLMRQYLPPPPSIRDVAGLPPNQTNRFDGTTPLILAVRCHASACVLTLHRRGASEVAIDKAGCMAADYDEQVSS